jgi:hypothetical protein
MNAWFSASSARIIGPLRAARRMLAPLVVLAIILSAVSLATIPVGANDDNEPPLNPSGGIHFQLSPNSQFLRCFAQFPDNASRVPRADVVVVRGRLNDTLELTLHNFKPGLGFDLFTVQRSALDANGTTITPPPGVGFAWYQSDIQVDGDGRSTVRIKTILLDQIFGFDPDVNLPPTNTFHVGFWFDNPQDAVRCGFDPTHPTPFNGEHKAGPLAMISVPDATTNLGPLCTKPNTSTKPAHCDA